jgi:hypothetical protein
MPKRPGRRAHPGPPPAEGEAPVEAEAHEAEDDDIPDEDAEGAAQADPADEESLAHRS